MSFWFKPDGEDEIEFWKVWWTDLCDFCFATDEEKIAQCKDSTVVSNDSDDDDSSSMMYSPSIFVTISIILAFFSRFL
jgi:hypothetical protein